MTASEYIAIELMRLNGKIEAIKQFDGWERNKYLLRAWKIALGEYDGLLRAKLALK